MRKIIKIIVSRFCKIRIYGERFYTRLMYRTVVNDLRIIKNVAYTTEGAFPTMHKKQPKNYRKYLKVNNLDINGIPTKKYNGKNNEAQIGYNPVLIANYGLSEYGYYLSDKQQNHLNSMQNVAQWIICNQDAESGCWFENFDYYSTHVSSWLKSPWLCGMGQGECISFLSRYYLLTKDPVYIEAAKRGVQAFKRNVSDNGVVSYFHGIPIYEEYPTSPDSHVLNGFIYSIFGLYDYFSITGDSEAKELFDRGVSSIEKILPYYDDSHCSYYDLGHITAPCRKPNQNWKYHIIHINLLNTLYSITQSEILKFYANKWSNQ